MFGTKVCTKICVNNFLSNFFFNPRYFAKFVGMETATNIIELACWISFALAIGAIEGVFFHLAKPEKIDAFNAYYGDIHGYLNIVRAVVMFGIVAPPLYLTAVLVFPLLHDGAYYIIRNELNPKIYKKRFRTVGALGTTAKVSFTYRQRLIFAGIGTAVAIIYLTII